MTNVGIITCSNAVNEMCCTGFSCYNAAYAKADHFSNHSGEIRIKGMISCAGCPGKFGYEKILRKINALVASGAEVLHLAKCMVEFCPFISKYEQVIQKAYPTLKIVRGTHADPYKSEALMGKIAEETLAVLTKQTKTAPEIVEGLRNLAEGSE